MSHLLSSAPPRPTGRLGRVLAMVSALSFAAVPLLVVGGSSNAASAAVMPQAAASGPVTLPGKGEFSDVRFTVDQTGDLVNQAVRVSWTGATQSLTSGAGFLLGNYMQLMQCWAEPGTAPVDVPREQCQYGAFVDVPDAGGNTASRQVIQFRVDPLETTYVQTPENPGVQYVHFQSVDGTEETTRRSQFFDAASTNEIPTGRTAPDGTGLVNFEMETGLEAAGLGCGQVINGRTPDCFLTIVPRGTTEVDGHVVGSNIADYLETTPLSATNWANRVVFPLQFRAVGGACSFGRTETSTVGSDFVTEAMTSWQSILCGLGPRNYSFTSLSDESTRSVLTSDDPGLTFVTEGVPAAEGAVYAPISVSALTFVASIDRQMPNKGPDGKTVLPDDVPGDIRGKVGQPFTQVNLTPRLVAKLLTQSYRFDLAYGTSSNIFANPFDLASDPDFLAVNPEFNPQGYTSLYPNSVGRVLVNVGLTDSADLVWRYVLSDEAARDFLAGKPDPWGMVLNKQYLGQTLPTNSFPRADLGCAIPPTAPSSFTLPNCTLDVFPYSGGFSASARQVSRGDTGRRNVPKLGQVLSYGLEANQIRGQRSMAGLTDTASAARYSQYPVALLNKGGQFVVPTSNTMDAGLSQMTPDAEGLLRPNLTSTDPTTYPLTVVTYAATVPGKLSANQRSDYGALLSYAATDGQVRGTAAGDLPAGYLPLPADLRAKTAAAASALKSYTPPTPTPTPTPDESITPTPTGVATDEPTLPVDTGGGDGGVVPSTGGATPSPAPTTPAPTASPSTSPVAALGTTPADPASASRLALLAALSLGTAALLARVLLPWVASRRT